jgi:serine/threonine protein kinase
MTRGQRRAKRRASARGWTGPILRAVRVCPRCRAIYSSQIVRCPNDGERVAQESTYPWVGETIDRYRFVEAIGEGAMGCVYRATHSVLPREYAIKVIFKDLASNTTLIERFRREAQAMSAIAHPNIVTVQDFVTTSNGMTFIVMELVQGRTLDIAIGREAPFTPVRAARIARQIAAGLGEAHRMGFVHRDVKPSNIMLAEGGEQELVKILDFGVVGLGAAPVSTRLTAIGHIIGTPTYMAPEQVHDPAVGPSADLYALGVILFEMLAGEPPFSGPGRTEVFVKHISEPPPPLPPSDGLELLVAWLLEKHPERRPRGAEDVINAIDRLGITSSPEPSLSARRPQAPKVTAPETRPLIVNADLIESHFEGDTFEPDTDSAIPKDAVTKALQDTDPERSVAPAVNGKPNGDRTIPHPVYDATRENRIAPEPRRPGSSDEMFPSLVPVSASPNDWASWNPDGIFEPILEESDERPDTVPVPIAMTEGPTTDPVGVAPLLLEADETPSIIDPDNTQLVRDRKHSSVPAVATELNAPAEDSDSVLYEPELPDEGGEQTQPGRVDDGPTQVDFNFEDASAVSGPTRVHMEPRRVTPRPELAAEPPEDPAELLEETAPPNAPIRFESKNQRDTEPDRWPPDLEPAPKVSAEDLMDPRLSGSSPHPAAGGGANERETEAHFPASRSSPTDVDLAVVGRPAVQPSSPTERAVREVRPSGAASTLPARSSSSPKLEPIELPRELRQIDPDMLRGDTVIKEISSPQLDPKLLESLGQIGAKFQTVPDTAQPRRDPAMLRSSYPGKEIKRAGHRILIGLVLTSALIVTLILLYWLR